MTEATYDLYWLVVAAGRARPRHRRRAVHGGRGRAAGSAARRIVRVETSSLEGQGGARRFYEKTGFRLAGAIATSTQKETTCWCSPRCCDASRRPGCWSVHAGHARRGRARLAPACRAPAPPRPGRRLRPAAAGHDRDREPAPPSDGAARRGAPSRPSCGGCCWRRGCSRRPGRTRARRPPRGRGSRSRPSASRRARKGEARAQVRLRIDTRPSDAPGALAFDLEGQGVEPYAVVAQESPRRRAGGASRRRPSLSALVVRVTRDLIDGVAARRRLQDGSPTALHAALVADGGELREEAIRIVGERQLRDEVPDPAQAARRRRRDRSATRRWGR